MSCKCGCYLTDDYINEWGANTTDNKYILCPMCEEEIEIGYVKSEQEEN